MSDSLSKYIYDNSRFSNKNLAGNRNVLIGFTILSVIFGISLAFIAVNISPLLAVIALLGIPAGIIFFTHPEVGLIALTFLIPFENINILTISGFSVFELFTLVAYSTALAYYLVLGKHGSLVKSKENWLLLIFLLFVVLSNITALDQTRSIDGTFRLVRNVSLYFFAINLIRSKKMLNPLLWGLILSGTISALYGLYAYYFDPSLLDPKDIVLRVRGTMDDPNEFAGAMVVRLMIAVGMLGVVTKKYQRVLLISSSLVLVYGILLSGSRGGVLGLAAAFFAYVLTRQDKVKWLTVGGIVAVVGLLIMPLSLKERIGLVQTSANVGNDLDRRVTYLYLGQELITENPILGIGLDGFATAYAESDYRFLSSTTGRVAHNTYLEIATGTGLPGFLIFLLILGYAYFKSWKLTKVISSPNLAKISAGVFAGLTGFLIILFFLSQQYEKTLWLLIALVIIIEQLYLKDKFLAELKV